MSRFIVAPLDVVKIRLQLQSHSLSDPLSQRDLRGGPVYKGTIPTIRKILANEGLAGLWKGNVPAELMYVCYGAAQFTAYRYTTVALHGLVGEGNLPPSAESFIAGATAGGMATGVTYPLDLLRTRFAAQGNERVYRNLRHAVVQIWRDEGVRGYFRGIGPGLAQIVPYMGIFFSVYESLRLPLGQIDLPYGGGDAVAGVAASLLAKTATFPLDLVRKRIQVQGPTRGQYVHKNIPEYASTVRAIRMIAAQEGFRGLYRGLTVSLLKAAPASSITIWTYERALKLYIRLGEGEREFL